MRKSLKLSVRVEFQAGRVLPGKWLFIHPCRYKKVQKFTVWLRSAPDKSSFPCHTPWHSRVWIGTLLLLYICPDRKKSWTGQWLDELSQTFSTDDYTSHVKLGVRDFETLRKSLQIGIPPFTAGKSTATPFLITWKSQTAKAFNGSHQLNTSIIKRLNISALTWSLTPGGK